MKNRGSSIRAILINTVSGILILFLATLLNYTEAQVVGKKYYDSNWKVVEKESEASYYRLYTERSQEDSTITAEDYYITGELQWRGQFLHMDSLDSKNDIQHGRHEWFLKNGTKIRSAGYFEGQILNDMIYDSTSGKRKRYKAYYGGDLSHVYIYNENGKLEVEESFKYSFIRYFYENGNIKLYAQTKGNEIHGQVREYYKSGQLKQSGIFRNGKLGSWVIECDEIGNCDEIFSEIFDSDKNVNNWPLNPNSDEDRVFIKAGTGLVMNINEEPGYHDELITIPIDQSKDFSIEAVLKSSNNTEGIYGIMWGEYDRRNYFSFNVSTDGYFSVKGYRRGIEVVLVDWTKSSDLNVGNKGDFLQVSKVGDKYFFSVNTKLVATSDFWPFKGNNTGVFVLTSKNDFEVITESFFVYKDYEAEESSVNSEPETQWRGNGTGFFVSKEGHIATNYHVIESSNDIEVSFSINGQNYDYPAKIVNIDRANDLAILKIDKSNFELFDKIPYSISATTSKIGDDVFTLGFPMALSYMGEEIKFTDGSINSLSGYQGDIRTYQVSVPIQPGNSGGPLFDTDGNVIGIITSGLSKDIADNVGYAFKSSYLRNLIDLLPVGSENQKESELNNLERSELIKKLSSYVVLVKTS